MVLLNKIKNKLHINYRKKRWPGLIEAYKQYLPVTKKTPIISLNEGNTPLILSEVLSNLIGNGTKVFLKYDGLNPTGSADKEIRTVLNKEFEVPITVASKLVYSEIGNVFLTRLSSIIHPPRADDERTGMLALRASVIQGIHKGNGKINLINFFEGYPTKTVILDVSALSKVMNKVESISDLLDFFTNSPLEKIKTN